MKGCTKCGACCLEAKFFGLPHPDGATFCAHLAEDLSCKVYGSRPKICRVAEWTEEVDKVCDLLFCRVWEAPR